MQTRELYLVELSEPKEMLCALEFMSPAETRALSNPSAHQARLSKALKWVARRALLTIPLSAQLKYLGRYRIIRRAKRPEQPAAVGPISSVLALVVAVPALAEDQACSRVARCCDEALKAIRTQLSSRRG